MIREHRERKNCTIEQLTIYFYSTNYVMDMLGNFNSRALFLIQLLQHSEKVKCISKRQEMSTNGVSGAEHEQQ